MPLWVHPLLRFRQAAAESEGLIQSRNSVSMTLVLAAEAAHTATKPTIPGAVAILRGNTYKPSTTT